MKTLCVVPAYNEEQLVVATIDSLKLLENIDEIVVIDDCSIDRTALRASSRGVRVVTNGRNLGKGGSLNRVLPHFSFDFLLMVDADLGESARQAEALLKSVLEDRADLAIAAFPPAARKGGLGLVKGLAKFGLKKIGGVEFVSPISGQRAMNRRAFEATFPFDPGFGVEVGMTLDALKSGLRVLEVKTSMSHRETGRSMSDFLHRGKQFRDIFASLLRRCAGNAAK